MENSNEHEKFMREAVKLSADNMKSLKGGLLGQ